MIPKSPVYILEIKTEGIENNKNYKMHYEDKTINGYRDNLSTIEQVVYKILNTERYEHIIYSWNYGIELRDLFGEPTNFVCIELERRISEALVQDERIESVDTFSFNVVNKGSVYVEFVVHSVFGDVNLEKEVRLGV